MTAPLSPRHLFHPHAALPAVHTPHAVNEIHGQTPQGNELKSPPRQPVVLRSAPATPPTHRSAPTARTNLHLQRQLPLKVPPFHFSIHERLVFLDAIEDRFQLHPGGSGGTRKYCNSIVPNGPQDALLPRLPRHVARGTFASRPDRSGRPQPGEAGRPDCGPGSRTSRAESHARFQLPAATPHSQKTTHSYW